MGAILAGIMKWIVGPIAGPVFLGAFILTAGAFAVSSSVQAWKISTLTTERDGYLDDIYNPSTGWIAKHTQCETNVGNLRGGLDLARADIDKLGVDTKARDDARDRDMKAALAGFGKRLTDTSNKLLEAPPTQMVGSLEACRAGAAILKRGQP